MKRLNNDSGQMLIMVAVSMAMLLGFAALATDIGVMLHEKRLTQSAADSAAIAAALATSNGNDATVAGLADAKMNGFTVATNCASGSTVVCISPKPVDGPFTGQIGYVEATITQQAPTFFMRYFDKNAMTISTRAVATYLGTADGCVYLLNPGHLTPAAHPWGKSTLTMPGCGIIANGEFDVGGNGTVNAKSVAATGKIVVSGSGNILGGTSSGIPPITDPYAKLLSNNPPNPAYTPTITGSTCSFPGGTACFLNQPLTGNLNPGVYVYNQAIKFTGAVTSTNGGVTIMLLPGASFGTANASVVLTPPSSGLFDNVLIDAPSYTGELNLDFGMSTVNLSGVIYAPLADLSLQDQGGHTVDLVLNADLILATLDVGNKDNGNVTINRFVPASGPSPMPRISLVE